MKTENIAIVMTDIAGFTQTTQSQSRQQNAALLANHNRILLPLVRRFKGEHIKSIGDALLLVFRSPTDAMLCAMAMQDALYEYNRHVADPEQIHIRIAASAGEVRVTRNDVFGEAVNLTSRIESITPVDEIYLSEAVYMAMNKAEVPAREIGTRTLKGISAKVRLYELPRFATPRLVPVDVMEADDMADLAYPFGGAHFVAMKDAVARRGWVQDLAVGLVLLAILAGTGLYLFQNQTVPMAVNTTAALVAPDAAATPARPPVATVVTPAVKPTASLAYRRFSDLRQALKAGAVSERDYKTIQDVLTQARDADVEAARRDYMRDRLSLQEYRVRVETIEQSYR